MTLVIKPHRLLRQHYHLSKPGIGTFEFCVSRLPWGRALVTFRAEESGGLYGLVPQYSCADGELLLNKMIRCDSAEAATGLLLSAYREMGRTA